MPLKQRPCALLDFDCRKRRSVGDYTTKPKKPKKLRRFKNTTSLPARKPNNNPSTRGTQLKTHK